MVHKPSERSAAPGARLTELVAARLPAGVLELGRGGCQAGAALAAHPGVDLVAHIGSSAAGASVRVAVRPGRGGRARTAARTPCWSTPGWTRPGRRSRSRVGAFTNAGQLCTSVERVYLHADVADAVLAELVRPRRALGWATRGSDGTTSRRWSTSGRSTGGRRPRAAARRAGARLLTGGTGCPPGRTAYAPTVLADCTDEMRVMAQETFGPVAAIAVVDSWERRCERAAEAATAWRQRCSRPTAATRWRAIEELEVGTVKVNAVFGGAPGGSADPRRDSGRGAGYGPDLLREMVVLKAVHLGTAPVG